MAKPTPQEIRDIGGEILLSLLKIGKVGGNHTSFKNIPKGFRSDQKKRVKKVARILIKEEFINSHPTEYGEEISINPKKMSDIIKIPIIIDSCKNDPFLESRIKKYL